MRLLPQDQNELGFIAVGIMPQSANTQWDLSDQYIDEPLIKAEIKGK